jgi:hypothetical protein
MGNVHAYIDASLAEEQASDSAQKEIILLCVTVT